MADSYSLFLQRALDQLVGRLANGEVDHLFRQGDDALSDEVVQQAFYASAVAASENGEAIDSWRKRQSRRVPASFAETIAAAAARARKAHANSLNQVVASLVAAGVSGLSRDIDDLSLHEWTDVPSLTPLHPGRTWAGISGIRVTPKITSSFPSVFGCDVSVEVLLPDAQRGAHMSRLQSSLIEAEDAEHHDLDSFAIFVAKRIGLGQPQVGVRVRIEGDARFETRSQKTGKKSYIRGKVLLTLESDPSGEICLGVRGLSLDIATACPCTLRYSQLAASRALGLNSVHALPPTFTHSQPGVLDLKVSDKDGLPAVSFAELFRSAGIGAHLREAVLKRPDEHDLVERIHRRPQFAEDVARAVASEAASICDSKVFVHVEARLDESIHPHRASATCSGLALEFWSNPE